MLCHEYYSYAKIGFDRADNEPSEIIFSCSSHPSELKYIFVDTQTIFHIVRLGTAYDRRYIEKINENARNRLGSQNIASETYEIYDIMLDRLAMRKSVRLS